MKKFINILRTRTIARDLAVALVATMFMVFGLAAVINYTYSVERDRANLHQDANEVADNLASVLVTPMWNINNEEITNLIEVYRKSGTIGDIHLIDDDGKELIARRFPLQPSYLSLARTVAHEGIPIGQVTVFFSDANILQKQKEVLIYSVIVLSLLTLAIVVAIVVFLRRYLSIPFTKLATGLEVLSGGDYSHEIELGKQIDMNSITKRVNFMAKEIEKREAALEENQDKLETLNQAILDIFSCSDTNNLIKTAMTLVHKVCGVERGWFLAELQGAVNPDENESLPVPLVCTGGHAFETTESDVRPHIGLHDDIRTFTFAISSRYRTVGQLTLCFREKADASTISLMKSLMSLTNLAMTRQSFIRETAFIQAELQVAETVQQSMLPDTNRPLLSADVSYHYEPVLRVGGDWFSVTETRDGEHLYLILGDVTGHGLAQGLVTTAVAGAVNIMDSLIHDSDADDQITPSLIVTQLNRVLIKIAGKSNLHMTCVVARIDYNQGRMLVCNAGHTFPLRLSAHAGKSSLRSLSKKQQHMLGEDNTIVSQAEYEDAEYEVSRDEYLIFYTDGLTEAVDENDRPFDRKFFRHFRKADFPASTRDAKEDLMRLFRGHTRDVPVKDDVCLIVVTANHKSALTSQVKKASGS